MIRRLIFFDFLTLAPLLFFASVAETLQWAAITFAIGIFIVVFSVGQVRSLLHSVAEKNSPPNIHALPAILGPGLAGVFLILPGLLTDIFAGIVLLLSLVSVVKAKLKKQNFQHSKPRKNTGKEKKSRVIVVDYETIDEKEEPKKRR